MTVAARLWRNCIELLCGKIHSAVHEVLRSPFASSRPRTGNTALSIAVSSVHRALRWQYVKTGLIVEHMGSRPSGVTIMLSSSYCISYDASHNKRRTIADALFSFEDRSDLLCDAGSSDES